MKNRISDNHKWYYYAVTNAQGDVIQIRNSAGTVVLRYRYDAWGKLLSVTDVNGATPASSSFAYQLSIRYRGYVYDTETGLYYLQSRYYDPETGRFLNCDAPDYIGLDDTPIGWNGYAYCGNEPVGNSDPSGSSATIASYKRIFSQVSTILVLLSVIGVIGDVGIINSWNAIGWVTLGITALITIGGVVYIVYLNENNRFVLSKRTKIPSKLKGKNDNIKTPDTHPDEFNKKGNTFTHKKTKWTFKKDKSGHYRGPHWDAAPPNGKEGDYYDISSEGKILK